MKIVAKLHLSTAGYSYDSVYWYSQSSHAISSGFHEVTDRDFSHDLNEITQDVVDRINSQIGEPLATVQDVVWI